LSFDISIAFAVILLVASPASARAQALPPTPLAPPSIQVTPPAAPLVLVQPRNPYCAGEYADEMAALSVKAREFEQQQSPYTYCIRTSAVYECPSYAPDGTLRRTRRKVVAHGTGFGYRRQGGETLLVTNDHVAEWPAVTDDEHPADDVAPGCKRVSDSLKIVENERDAYERDDVALTRVVADPQLDIAVLRANAPLPIIPWKIGRSAILRERNAVDVRGFPLGVLRANNVGKVVSAYEHDEDRDWDHDDFVIDALLSSGSSGSPVFAISCKTGEFELVGVYHAGYTRASALNVVIGIDQLRDLLVTLKRSPRSREHNAGALDGWDRARLSDAVRTEIEPFFPFGSLTAAVRVRHDGALIFEVMGRDFPLQSHPVLVLEDLPAGNDGSAFGKLGRMWSGNRHGMREVDRTELDSDTQAQAAKLLESLRRDALLAASYRVAVRRGAVSRERYLDAARKERALRSTIAAHRYLGQLAIEMAERLCPGVADADSTLAAALAVPDGAGEDVTAQGPEAVATSWNWRPVIVGGDSPLTAFGSTPVPMRSE
jgi:serine protease Do